MNIRVVLRQGVFFLLVSLFVSGQCVAQPALHLKRTRVAWPSVEIYLSVGCRGVPEYSMRESNTRLKEDGREIHDYILWCPDPTSRCPISVALVFDASDSMLGEGNEGARAAGHAFVDCMDGVIDEGCVLYFSSQVTIPQHMTRDRALLHAAIAALPALGATAMWDALYIGLLMIVNQGENQCRAVVLLSDGDDNSSSKSLYDAISFAVLHNIRVFTVGYGSQIKSDELQLVASATGGKYYHTPEADELQTIYREISEIMFQHFQECVITYSPGCADGTNHSLSVEILDLCGGDDVKLGSYVAPLDTSTFMHATMALGNVDVPGGAEVAVPLFMQSNLGETVLYPFSFTLEYDRQLLELVRVETPPGSTYEGMIGQVITLVNGATVRMPHERLLRSAGHLLDLVFRSRSSTTPVERSLTVSSARFAKGCLVPEIHEGLIRIGESAPVMRCDIDDVPVLVWDSTMHAYAPDPFQLRLSLTNSGTLTAKSPIITLEFDSLRFQLLSPSSPTRSFPLDDILPENGTEIIFYLSAHPSTVSYSGDITARISFENHKEIECRTSINVPKAGLLLSCSLLAPPLFWDSVNKSYIPNPFTASLLVVNSGMAPSAELTAKLILPPGVFFVDGERATKSVAAQLNSGTFAEVSWELRPVTVLGDEYLEFRVELYNGTAFYTYCMGILHVHERPIDFTPTVRIIGPTEFCEGESVTLEVDGDFIAYRWSDGSRERRCVVRTAGEWFVTVMNAAGRVGQSDAVQIVVYPKPAKPVIQRRGDTLIVESEYSHRWFKNGSLLPGEQRNYYVVDVQSRYHVCSRNEWNCESCSDAFDVYVLSSPTAGSTLPATPFIEVYPDPAGHLLNVRIVGARRHGIVRILDLLGRLMHQTPVESGVMTLSTEAYAPGVYVIVVSDGSTVFGKRFLKL